MQAHVNLIENTDIARRVHNEERVKYYALCVDGNRVLVLTQDDTIVLRNALDANRIAEFSAQRSIWCIALDRIISFEYGTGQQSV